MSHISGTILATLAIVAVAVGCSGSVRTAVGDAGVTAPRVCAPGAQIPCACLGGASGIQFCEPTGDGYSLCIGCSSSGGTTSGSHGSGPGSGDGGVVLRHDGGAHSDGGSAGYDGGKCSVSSTDTVDHDGDGWSSADGDCNDCNKYINPGAYDVPGDGIDQDCNGTPDDEPTGCDTTVGVSSPATAASSDGVAAIDLCRTALEAAPLPTKTWGVISSDYVLPDGTSNTSANFALGFGILGPKFGTSNTTQQGVRMLGLSSGTARQPTDPGYQDVSGFDKGYTSGAPPGFPSQTPACQALTFGAPHDGAALRVVVRIPTNALTMSFDTNFFSYEFPDWICSPYNDTFVVIMTPSPTAEPTSAKDNIALDPTGNTIGVNSSFMEVCDMNVTGGASSGVMRTYACPEGPSKLLATGFGIDTTDNAVGDDKNQGSTDWLATTVSVASLAGKEVTLLFTVWDSSDGLLDSTVLIDNVRWTFATDANEVPPPALPPTTVPK